MALIVQLNTRLQSSKLSLTATEQYGFWDPLTGTNLNAGNLTSADLSGYSSTELANIADAVAAGILSVVSGATALPSSAETFSKYSSIVYPGTAGGDSRYGITSLAAADALENNF